MHSYSPPPPLPLGHEIRHCKRKLMVHEYTSSEAENGTNKAKVSVSQDADCGAILKKA